jgi:hypothetical protein
MDLNPETMGLKKIPCNEDDLSLCYAPSADPVQQPNICFSKWPLDWYYVQSNICALERQSSSVSVNATSTDCAKDTESEFDMDIAIPHDLVPGTMDDVTLYPNRNPIIDLPFTSKSAYWDWMFLSSNMITESKDISTKYSFLSKETNHFKSDGASKAKTKPKKSTQPPAFTSADLADYLFSGRRAAESDSQTFDHGAQQAKTEKHVRFFKENAHDKHFIPIPVDPLRGEENWLEWVGAMQMLFIQHGIWEVVINDIKPLAAYHPLHIWYQRMRDCAVGLIYANVSAPLRKHVCFLNAVAENDSDVLMVHLYAHYGGSIGPQAQPH